MVHEYWDKTAYTEEIWETFGGSSIKGVSTPLDLNVKLYKIYNNSNNSK